MPFKLTYTVNVDFVGAGQGGNQRVAQTLFFQKTGADTTVTQTFTAADVTTLTNGMAAAIAAQMNVPAVLAQIAAWPTGTG